MRGKWALRKLLRGSGPLARSCQLRNSRIFSLYNERKMFRPDLRLSVSETGFDSVKSLGHDLSEAHKRTVFHANLNLSGKG